MISLLPTFIQTPLLACSALGGSPPVPYLPPTPRPVAVSSVRWIVSFLRDPHKEFQFSLVLVRSWRHRPLPALVGPLKPALRGHLYAGLVSRFSSSELPAG